MTGENTWNTQELREMLIRGTQDLPALKDAGLLNDNDLRSLIGLKRHHPDGLKSDLAEQILERATSKGVQKAVQSGDTNQIAYAAGRSSNKEIVDMPEWKRYEAIKDLFRNPEVTDWTNNVFQMVIYSSQIPPTGRGKTSFGYTMIEIGQTVRDDLSVITNNPSDPFTDTPESWSDLEDMISDNDGWSLLMMDEAAQFLQYADQSEGLTLAQKMKLLRHEKCHLLLIGHTGKDVPADIRRQMFFADKTSEKTAVIGYGLDKKSSGDRMEVEDELVTLTRVPHTDVNYKSQGEKTIQINFDEPDEEDEEVDDETQEVVECQAETKSGESCPATAEYPSDNPVACYNHRNKIDDLIDDNN